MKVVGRFFERLVSIPYTPYLLVFVPLIIGSIRAAEEMAFFNLLPEAIPPSIYNFFIFYLLILILTATILGIAAGKTWKDFVGAASVGLLLGVLPPLIDIFIPNPDPVRYHFFKEFRWNLTAPYQPIGETITVWISIAGAAVFIAWYTRSYVRSLLALLLAYACMQFYSWGWRTIVLQFHQNFGLGHMALFNLSGLIAVLVIYVIQERKSMLPSAMRINHALPWGLVTAAGSLMAGEPYIAIINKSLVFFLAFQLIIFANDYFDSQRDGSAGGKSRPITRDDAVFVLALHFMLLLHVITVFDKTWFLMLLFMSLSVAYHLPQLLFKRLFCLSYKIEGIAAAVCFLFGISDHTGAVKGQWVPLLTLLILGGFSLCSMFKDYKDIDQDMANKIGTIYTRQLAKGHSLRNIHLFVSISTSLAMMVPPIMLLYWNIPVWNSIVLFVAGTLPAIFLLALRRRKLAVEATLWALSLYLLLLCMFMPAL